MQISGSLRRIQALQADFSRPPRFGRDLGGSGYTVHGVTNLPLRYEN